MKKYDFVGKYYEGLARVKLNNKYGFINKEGEEIIQCQYDWVSYFNEEFTELARVKLNNKYGIINRQGEEIIPCIYDWIYDFNENYYCGIFNNKYYLIDKNNYNVIECNRKVYENMGSESDLEVYYTNNYNIILFNTGCFVGNLKEFKEAVKYQYYYTNTQYYNYYMNIIKEYEK